VIELLLLDRDGVLNEKIENGYVTNPSQLSFIESTFDFLQENSILFREIGVVTNQQGIGKNLLTMHDLESVHEVVTQKFIEFNLPTPVYFICPHLSGLCECRKPKPKLIHDAVQYFDASPKTTLMIGDSRSDVEASISAGIRIVHLDNMCQITSCPAISHVLASEIFSF
jgi:D-glycero-D-manno-heptose 1,7-bisphosphate phosphatase